MHRLRSRLSQAVKVLEQWFNHGAAGAVGHVAVQLAGGVGATTVGTASGYSEAALLKSSVVDTNCVLDVEGACSTGATSGSDRIGRSNGDGYL